MQRHGNNISLFEGVDRVAIILYFLLVMVGLTCVASAGYDDMIDGFFNLRQNHVKQAFWACAAFMVGIFILLLDSRYYHMYAYFAYAGALVFTAGTIVMPEAISPVTNGAKAWYEFGPVRIQPAEFAKFAIARKVAVVPGSTFNCDAAAPSNAFRLNYSTPSDDDIRRGIAILGEVAREMLG